MKLNISNPSTGGQKKIDIEDDTKLRAFYEKRISHEVEGDVLGPDFKGYIFRIAGGNDKQGFPMLQGVLTAQRVRLLFSKGMPCYRPRKRGERKRKSVRGCIVSADLSVLHLVIVKKGEKEIPGLTDDQKPRRLGPKRASRIRKLFNLEKKDDVRQYVIRRQIVKEGKKPTNKAPKIQRLVTPQRLQHKREREAVKKQRYTKSRKEAEAYNTLMAKRVKEQREKRKAVVNKKRSISRAQSGKEETKKTEKTQAKPATDKGQGQGQKASQKGGKKEQEKDKGKKQAKPTGDKQPAAKQAAKPEAAKPKPTQQEKPKEKPAPQKQAPPKKDAPKKKKGGK